MEVFQDGRAADTCGVKLHTSASDGAIQPLRDHLAQVSAIAERVGRKIGLELLGGLVGRVHDLGKYSNQSQDYIMSANGLAAVYSAEEVAELRGLIDHSTLGARLLWNGAPHMQSKLHQLSTAEYGHIDTETTAFFKFGLLARMLTSILIDADRFDTADFMAPYLATMSKYGTYPALIGLIDQFEEKLKSFGSDTPIDVIRRCVSDTCTAEADRASGVRDELLNVEIFDTLLEAKVLIERWRVHYNKIRPHSSLGYRPPAHEAAPTRPLEMPLPSREQVLVST